MSRKITFAQNEFYHIYNRGTEKRKIFMDKADYERFLALLYLCNSKETVHLSIQGSTLKERLSLERSNPLVDICAYCLMPNHFHLLIREKTKNGISQFVHKVTTGYTMYFNKRNQRNGTLFQGRFKATHVKNDRYLKYLISYIHLNPVKIIEPEWKENGIKNKNKANHFLENYPYSSYFDFCGKNRQEKKIVNKTDLPQYFKSINNFKKTTQFWLEFQDFKAVQDFKAGP